MRFCNHPFHTLHVLERRYITCCGAWFTDLDDVVVCGRYDDLWKMWNHRKFQRLRQSWLDGDSSLCAKCPVLAARTKHVQVKDSYMKPIMEEGPRYITFANDETCNLHCWTCRARPITDLRQEEIFRQTHQVLETFCESVKWIEAIGSGDPFASPAWRKILQTLDATKYNGLEIELFTNGILLPKYWDSISNIHDNIASIKMSIDAATKAVYERTRLGSSFEEMIAAMKFISRLDKNFVVNMVVQSDNFTDIPRFIEQAFEYNATGINLNMMRYWPSMRGGVSKFDEHNLADPKHESYAEFQRLIQDNLTLLEDPRINWDELRCSQIIC